MPRTGTQTSTRRRGATLEAELLDAAWAEIRAGGYDGLTYDAVASRAHTSRAVLYRRWPTKRHLARAAIARVFAQDPVATPDTGSLRSDMVALLQAVSASHGRTGLQLAALLDADGDDALTLADLRSDMLAAQGSHMDAILARARERGEITAAETPPRAKSAALDLLRHDLLTSRTAPTSSAVEHIIDDVFLPLMQTQR